MEHRQKRLASMARRTVASIALTAAIMALGGCAIVGSQPQSAATTRTGLTYRLPKMLIPIELLDDGSSLTLRLLAPVAVGDPLHTYVLDTLDNPLSSDTIRIEVDPQTLLLKKVDLEGDDKTLQVLKDLIVASRSIGAVEAAVVSREPAVVFTGMLDPDGAFSAEVRQANAAMVDRMRTMMRTRLLSRKQDCNGAQPSGLDASGLTSWKAACAQAATLLDQRDVGLRIDVTLLGSNNVIETVAKASAEPADCSVGVCHRGVQPFRLSVGIAGQFEREAVLTLPNGGVPVVLPMDRAAFVKVKHVAEFDGEGRLTKYSKDRPSSLAELASWPLQVYRAVLTTTKELFTDRAALAQQQVEFESKMLEAQKELDRLRRERDELAKSQQPSPTQATKELGRRAGPAVLMTLPLVGRAGVPDRSAEVIVETPNKVGAGPKVPKDGADASPPAVTPAASSPKAKT